MAVLQGLVGGQGGTYRALENGSALPIAPRLISTKLVTSRTKTEVDPIVSQLIEKQLQELAIPEGETATGVNTRVIKKARHAHTRVCFSLFCLLRYFACAG